MPDLSQPLQAKSRVALALLVACASFGCGPEGALVSMVAISAPRSVNGIPHKYHAAPARQSERPGLAAVAYQIEVGQDLLVRLRLDSSARFALHRALLAPSVAHQCREGVRDRHFEVDGEARWARPFVLIGRHEVVFRFPTGSMLLDRPSALDLVLVDNKGAAACLRVPLNGPLAARPPQGTPSGPGAERPPAPLWKKNSSFATGGALRGYAPFEHVRGVGAGWSFEALFGVHVGPLRPQFEAGFGFARCREDCLDDPFGFLIVPLGMSLHWFMLDRDGVSLDLGLGARFLYATVGAEQTTRSFWMYAPTLSLRVADTVQHGVGLESGASVGSSGFELFLSRWSSPGLDASERSFVLGGAWAWDATW